MLRNCQDPECTLQYPPFPSPGFDSMCSRSSLIWCRCSSLMHLGKTAVRKSNEKLHQDLCLPSLLSSNDSVLALALGSCLSYSPGCVPCWSWPCLADLTSWLTINLPHCYGLVWPPLDCWLNLVTWMDLFCPSQLGEAVRPLPSCLAVTSAHLNFPCEAAHSWCFLTQTTVKL